MVALDSKRNDQQGQAITEYLLLLSIVAGFFFLLSKGIVDSGLMAKLLKPLKTDYAMAYKYGHPKAKGYDEGGPKNHPRADPEGNGDNNNFRIFRVAK